ncbi:MAG: DMT family transporter [Myxococcota bacterium]|nr:DMT family transporter [Myxococcota bacterium]
MSDSQAPTPTLLVGPVLALAVAAISAAAILVRLVPEISPVSVAFWRTLMASALFLPMARRISRRDGALIVVAGAFMALHFWAWFTSLHSTTVLRSTLLVCLAPVWVGLIEALFLGSAPPRRFWVGISLALLGVALLSSQGSGETDVTLLGDGLALLGGVLSAVYLLIGRTVRQRVHIGSYGAWICLAAAGWLGIILGVTGAPLTGWGASSWGVLAALAVGPQVMGHMGLNYAIRYVPAGAVAAVTLLEPAGAALLAWIILDEAATWIDTCASGLALAGVGLAVVRRERTSS